MDKGPYMCNRITNQYVTVVDTAIYKYDWKIYRVHGKMFRHTDHLQDYILLTYSMQRSPSSEDNRFSASPEIPRVLCNPKVHYPVYKGLPPVPIQRQLNPFHAP
jgi:hypothetical protein